MRAVLGVFQLTPRPPKKPFVACAVTAKVTRVRFWAFDTTGGNVPSVPTSVVPVRIEAVLLDVTAPLTSASARTTLRDGTVRPAPHWNAPPGVSKPSGLPRHS